MMPLYRDCVLFEAFLSSCVSHTNNLHLEADRQHVTILIVMHKTFRRLCFSKSDTSLSFRAEGDIGIYLPNLVLGFSRAVDNELVIVLKQHSRTLLHDNEAGN